MKRLVFLAIIGLAACSGEEIPPVDVDVDLGGGTEDTGGGDVGGSDAIGEDTTPDTDTTPDPDTAPDPDAVEDTVDPDVDDDTPPDPDTTPDPDAVEDTTTDTSEDTQPDGIDDIGFDEGDFGGPVCGDGIWDINEECDGLIFDVCTTYGYDGGEITCGDDCKLDFSACEGERRNAAECTLERFSLSAECDGCVSDSCATELTETFGAATFPPAEVGGACGDFFTCLEGCACGDFDCEDACYTSDAWFGCEAATETLDECSADECLLACTCGNGFIDEGEQCDTADGGFLFDTCIDLGYDAGELACTSECVFDESDCTGERGFCGDGILDWGLDEQCDGSIDRTCEDLGFEGGESVCTDCREDFSGCTLTVTRDGGTCEEPVVFEDAATVGDDGAMTASDTTVGAGANLEGDCAGRGREVVFTWTPATTDEFTLSTAIPDEGDSALYVRTACADSATEIDCNDDWADLESRVFVNATAGTTYFVVVDSFSLARPSAFDLRIETGRIDDGGGVAPPFPDGK